MPTAGRLRKPSANGAVADDLGDVIKTVSCLNRSLAIDHHMFGVMELS